MANNLKLTTFNCTGCKSSESYIGNILCAKYHLIALQETWLLPHELARCDAIHPDFNRFATSAVDTGGRVLRGRPYGGLAWLWHKTLDSKVKPVVYGENRILGLRFNEGNSSILFLNVYMPTQTKENNLEFLRILGKIASIIEESSEDGVCLMGDWNANIDTYYYKELMELCVDKSLVMVDVDKLPCNSYTHVSEAHNSTSWLDHMILSKNISIYVSKCEILYGGASSNHFPLSCEINGINNILNMTEIKSNGRAIQWKFDCTHGEGVYKRY